MEELDKIVDGLLETNVPLTQCSKSLSDPVYIKDSLKSCYDLTHQLHNKLGQASDVTSNRLTSTLDKLYVTGPDSEQIWQQLEHCYNNITSATADDVPSLGTLSFLLPNYDNKVVLGNGIHEQSDSTSHSEHEDFSSDELSDASVPSVDDESEEEMEDNSSSQTDDRFFSMKSMEAVLDRQDAEYMKDPDAFERMSELYDTDSGSEEHDYMYSDLFDEPGNTKVPKNTDSDQEVSNEEGDVDKLRRRRNPMGDIDSEEEGLSGGEDEQLSDEELELQKALDEETANQSGDVSSDEQPEEHEESRSEGESEDDSDAEHLQDVLGRKKNESAKSQYERRTEKLRERITAMEEEALSDKPWQLKGEVTAKSRPENSLIQEAVEFDANVAPVPAITMETTQNLETLIMQRIKDKAFDDVERKTRLKEDGERYKKRIELDHEKSKQSLSQIYEQEYLKLRDNKDDEEEKEDPEEAAIKRMMTSLFSKLDALSSFHCTPKPAPKEIKIVSHLPTVVMEEVQPDTVADSAQLAPEEIKRSRVEVKDRSERDETDKKRIRRQKKAKNRKKEQLKKKVEARVQKINPGLGNKRAEQRSIEAIKQAVVNEGRVLKPTKESLMSDKTYSSSKEFFKALQTEVKLDKKSIRTKADLKKRNTASKSAEKLKL